MSSVVPQRRVVVVNGIPMSALIAAVADPRAVIVAIHGGATTSAYFDCPGNPRLSLLRSAASHGCTAIAVDRPGYGASALYQDDMASPDFRVALAFGVVDKLVEPDGRGSGMFLMGHSAGCELALRMTVDDRAADVLGLELAGTGLRYDSAAKAVIKEATLTSRPGLRELLWQPTELYPEDVLTSGLSAPGVQYEAEVTTNWSRRDFPALAARVRVPVEFSVADNERVWDTTPEALTVITEMFTASPRVVVNEVADSGHNLSVALSAQTYHERVLSFVDGCIDESLVAGGSIETEAGP